MNPVDIDVFLSAHSFAEDEVRNKTVVVIDVLRACSSMVTAFANGAKAIIPVEDMAGAGKIVANLEAKNVVLCGEKDGKKIEGYQLGNSPMEYTREVVDGRTLVMNTTNGTKAVTRSALAKRILIGSFLNAGAVVEQLRQSEEDILIVCSGWKSRFSLEDTLCAGLIIDRLCIGNVSEQVSDSARMAHMLYRHSQHDLESEVRKSSHARRLKDLADPADIPYCCTVDLVSIVPHLKDGIIVP